MTLLGQLGASLQERQRWVLIALLAVFHLALLAGGTSMIGLMCWLVDAGLFILWQPFVDAQRKIAFAEMAALALLVAASAWLFGWWLLIFWAATLAALVGGRVMFVDHRPTRIFYLLAFAYLLAALLVVLVPKVVPETAKLGPSLDREFGWAMPLLFGVMLLLPRQARQAPRRGIVDFFYSLFIFLLIAVLVLGSLAFTLLRQSNYIEAVFHTLIVIALMLLVLGWAWNPRPGFSGIGVFFSRYLLSIGLPFEQWLHRLTAYAGGENDPERFLARALDDMRQLPWVTGGAWEAAARTGSFGEASRHRHEFANQPLHLTLSTRYEMSPALVWHFHLLAQLLNEYYVAKVRGRELQQLSYLRAVHETGARLTHDVKNLLQSLNNLCYLAQTTDGRDTERLNQLLQRQLPLITQRLQQTLDKLQKPQGESGEPMSAQAWWTQLQQRYACDALTFAPVTLAASTDLPAALFDSVADNLLQNVLAKRQVELGVKITVALAADASSLCVCDDGSAVAARILPDLLQAPVASENGLGIGLYQAARQAEVFGYALRLASNEDGRVCFELQRGQAPIA
jgi:hypothetical protein